MNERMNRVLVVDDSAFMRRVVSDLITDSEGFTVAGTARDGEDALARIPVLNPDIITLDIEMPGIDGLETLRRIMTQFPRPVVMLSAGGSDGGASATLTALELGAVDFIAKPSGPISLDLSKVQDALRDALHAAADVRGGKRLGTLGCSDNRVGRQRTPRAVAAIAASAQLQDTLSTESEKYVSRVRTAVRTHRQSPPERVVCIASSTGGPAALTQVIPQLAPAPRTAFIVVQHLPEQFTASLAKRLDQLSRMPVTEVAEGMRIESEQVYVARGGAHLSLRRSGGELVFGLHNGPPIWGVRPAADPLFRDAAELFGSNCAGVVMTGMGRDGADGLDRIRKSGGIGIVQHRDSCVIPGMPVAAFETAGADHVVMLNDLATVINDLLESARVPAVMSREES